MRRICTLAALLTVALGSGADGARAAHIETPPAQGAGAVTAVSVVPADGRADVVIAVSGTVSVNHFTVENPNRIVVDISEARLGSFPRRYDGRPRGGITDIRFAQNRPGVVRVVVQTNAPLEYAVTRTAGAIRVNVATSGEFAAWASHDRPVVAQAERPAATPPAPAADRPTPPPATPPAATPPAATPPAAQVATPPAAPPAADRAVGARLDTMPTTVATRPVASESAGFVATPIDSALSTMRGSTVFAGGSRAPLVFAAARQQQSQQPRITVTYVNADISEVVAGFAARFNRTIILGSTVEAVVNAEINDQPWDVALKAILDAHGLAATEEPSGIIVIDSYQNILRRQANEPLTTQMVNINYVPAGSLVETVRQLLSKDCPETAPLQAAGAQTGPGGTAGFCLQRGSVAADSGTNALLITEVTSRMPNLLNYIRQLDVRTPQVNLKARIISVSRTQIEQLGLSYDLGSSAAYFNTVLPRPMPGSESSLDQSEGRVLLGGEAIAGVANASRRFRNGAALNLLFTTAIGNYSLSAFLDALREQQLSDIQAEPSVTTLDNREARMMVGQETPVRVIDAGSAGQIGVPPRANVQFKETGIILTVTPHITSNRQIRMQISAEQSELRIVGGDLGFTIDKRNATTQVLVNDGETAVIGGLTQTQITRNKSGIPLLSDLPMLGRLFSQTDMREEKRDLLILITPRILEPGDAIRPPGDGN